MSMLLELFLTFFKIGAFTFGGGYAMLPLIQQEVLDKGWMSLEQIVDFIAVSESTPGPFAINIATYVGAETAGVLGSVMATLGTVLPSFMVILIVAQFYLRFKNSRAVSGVMYGLRSVVVGLMAAAVVGMVPTVFFAGPLRLAALATGEFWCALGIFSVMLVLALKKRSPILIIILSALAGVAFGLVRELLL